MNSSLTTRLLVLGLLGMTALLLLRRADALLAPAETDDDATEPQEEEPAPAAATVADPAPSTTLELSSPSFGANAPIPRQHSAYGEGVSPALSWTPVDGAKTYLLLMEDPDAPTAAPFVHWLAWNIPGEMHQLPQGLQKQTYPEGTEGLLQGRNGDGSVGYFGPRPPAGDPPHHYHLRLLALDTVLSLPASTTREALLQATLGHVLAHGELVGTFEQPSGE